MNFNKNPRCCFYPAKERERDGEREREKKIERDRESGRGRDKEIERNKEKEREIKAERDEKIKRFGGSWYQGDTTQESVFCINGK